MIMTTTALFPPTTPLPKRQRGAATLAISLLMLIGVTMVGLVTARSSLTEQRISANDYRAQQAFEGAEAGIEEAIAQLTRYTQANLSDANGDDIVEFDTDGDGTGDTTEFTGTLTNGSSYTASVGLITAGDFDTLEVLSTGNSDDGTGERMLRVVVQVAPSAPNVPSVPLTAKGTVDLSGTVEIANTFGTQTIWSGGDTTLSGSAATQSRNGGSDSSSEGSDIADNDGTLTGISGDEFFENFFGATKQQIKSEATVYTGSGNYSATLDGQRQKTIWIDAGGGDIQINSNTVVGTVADPVVLIVDNMSSMHANGNLVIYGMMYVIGDWDNSGGGTTNIYGAALNEGSLSGTGTPDVTYDPTVLNNLGNTGAYAKVAGSWRDF